MLGLLQAIQPIPHYEPTPPEHAFALPPNLNTADLDTLLELPGITPELAQQIITTRPHLNWEHLEQKLPQWLEVWQSLRGKVRF